MKFDLGAILTKLPEIIRVGTIIAQKIKAPGADKKQIVYESIPDVLATSEIFVGDLFNDPEIMKLVGAVIDAEAAVRKAQAALKAGLLTKVPATP